MLGNFLLRQDMDEVSSLRMNHGATVHVSCNWDSCCDSQNTHLIDYQQDTNIECNQNALKNDPITAFRHPNVTISTDHQIRLHTLPRVAGVFFNSVSFCFVLTNCAKSG